MDPGPALKAIVFDVYGTLFISGSGDISLAQEQDRDDAMMTALELADVHVRAHFDGSLSERFHLEIRRFQDLRRKEGIEFPEVDIRDVWEAYIERLVFDDVIELLDPGIDIDLLSVDYECRVNPVYPMPGLGGVLAALNKQRFTLGIVSNAQYFTPLLFPAYLNADLGRLGFLHDLCVFSYVEREAKPSTRLYEKLAEELDFEGISPEEALYVGNDMRNDIWPAAKVGFKTALFAGDRRSLRLRPDHREASSVRPDYVIKELESLLKIL